MSGKVTAEMVKQLRELTGVGMAKCKEALDHAQGDIQLAVDNLRKAGMASAVKKEGRETNEGMIGFAQSSEASCLVEVNAETDFVTQNDKFKAFVSEIAQEVADTCPGSLEAFLQQPYRKDPAITIDQQRALVIQSVGENIQIKRLVLVRKEPDLTIGSYAHMGGKIVVLVELLGSSGEDSFARDIAMHIAAEAPEYVRPEDVPAETVEREKEIARSQVQGKPPQVADKIIEGKLKAFYDQVCVLGQKYVKDSSITVADLLAQESKRLGKTLSIRRFIRWRVGGHGC